MALPGYGDLQRLANPPGRIRGQAGAVADIEAINGLHQTANRLLQKIRIAESMMAKPLRDVSGQPNVGRGEAMFVMDVAIVQAPDRGLGARLGITVIPNKLGHRPRLKGRTMRAQAGKMADQHPHQLALAFPKARQ